MNAAEKTRDRLYIKCRAKSGMTAQMALLDISAGGCMVEFTGCSAQPGERVLMTFPGLATQPGELVWVEDGKAGIVLEQPLYAAVLDHLQARLAE